MIAKEIIEAATPAIYSWAIHSAGNNPLFDRESFLMDSISEFWWAVIDKIEMYDTPPSDVVTAENFVYVLKQYLPELIIKPIDGERIVIDTGNWSYTICNGILGIRGVEIYPQYKYVSAERAQWLIQNGLNPKVENVERFLARLLIEFDRSIPEMKQIIHDIEYKALFDYKEHELRKTVLRSILEPYRLNPAFFIIDGKTKCVVEIDGWTVSFFVSSDDMQSFSESLPVELPEIMRNPKNALKFGGKYSVE